MRQQLATALLGRQIMTQAVRCILLHLFFIGEIFYYTSHADKSLCQLDIGNKIKTMELMCKDISQLDKLDSASVKLLFGKLHDMIVQRAYAKTSNKINSIIKLRKNILIIGVRSMSKNN